LGIDPGSRRIGLAVGDDRTGVVTPLAVIASPGREEAARVIAALLSDHNAERVVIGLPSNADGEETPACARSHCLAHSLAKLDIVAVLQPEYLSSSEARRRARAAGRRPEDAVDDLAACVILEDFFASRADS
jgi:putative Holliday junction resolvase